MKKPIVNFDSQGPSGNIFYILGLVRESLRKQRRIIDYNECWEKVQASGSYEEALRIIREYVELIDVQGRY